MKNGHAIEVDVTRFHGLGDSPWWPRFTQKYMPDLDVRFASGAKRMIYDPHISALMGNRGLEIVKDGSVMDLMPSDARIVISTVQEPISSIGQYPWHENIDLGGMIERACHRLGLSPENFAHASGDANAVRCNHTNIRTFFVPGWNHWFWPNEWHARTMIDLRERTFSKTFLSFNRYIKSHRYYMIARLHQEGMLADNLVSCPRKIYGLTFKQWGESVEWELGAHAVAHDPHGLLNWPYLRATADELMDLLPLVLDVDDVSNTCFEDDTLLSSIPYYQSSFMSIVTESNAHGPGLYPSEAIFRPIIFKQPFMTIAQPGMLSLLRGWGFDTFDDIFDNSYDGEPCQYMRTEMVIANAKRFCAMPETHLRSLTMQLAPRLEANMERYFGEEFRSITRGYAQQVYNWLYE